MRSPQPVVDFGIFAADWLLKGRIGEELDGLGGAGLGQERPPGEVGDDVVAIGPVLVQQQGRIAPHVAEHRIPALRPNVAVLDARLPDGSGIDVCRAVRSVDPTIQALILTSYEDDEALFAAIMAGAAGYVLKQIRGTDLVDAMRRVAAGQSLLDPAVTARVLDRIRRGPDQPDELKTLTEQEKRILALVAEGLTNREIAQRMFLSEKTIKNYVSSLLAKLGMERRTQAAVLAAKLLGKT